MNYILAMQFKQEECDKETDAPRPVLGYRLCLVENTTMKTEEACLYYQKWLEGDVSTVDSGTMHMRDFNVNRVNEIGSALRAPGIECVAALEGNPRAACLVFSAENLNTVLAIPESTEDSSSLFACIHYV